MSGKNPRINQESGASDPREPSDIDLGRSVILRSGAFALGLVTLALAAGCNDSERSTKAVCQGEQTYTVDNADGTSHLLALIEGGTANPEDATRHIIAMNPNMDPSAIRESELQYGRKLTLPKSCFSEDANRMASQQP